MRKSFRVLVMAAAFGAFIPAPRAHAVSKEIIQLQVQVQALQNAVQQLQQSEASQLGMIQSMLQQNTQTVEQINKTIGTLENQVQAQQQAGGGKIDQVSTQIQNLNDSLDGLQRRIEKLSHQVQAVQTQMQTMQAAPPAANGAPMPGGTGASPQAGANGQNGAAQPQGSAGNQAAENSPGNGPDNGAGSGSGNGSGNGTGNGGQAANAMPQQPTQQTYPPIQQLYQVALSDYNAGRYDLSAGEFADVVKDYPYDQLSGQAQFYVGESYYREQKYQKAIQAYEQVLSQYPGSAKAPASRLHKAYAELAMGQRSSGVHDLQDLIGRFPQSPEAAQGRLRLNGLLASSSTKPTPYE